MLWGEEQRCCDGSCVWKYNIKLYRTQDGHKPRHSSGNSLFGISCQIVFGLVNTVDFWPLALLGLIRPAISYKISIFYITGYRIHSQTSLATWFLSHQLEWLIVFHWMKKKESTKCSICNFSCSPKEATILWSIPMPWSKIQVWFNRRWLSFV